MEEFLKINSTDGKSRVYDAENNLISVDGVKVKKELPIIAEKKKEGGKE